MPDFSVHTRPQAPGAFDRAMVLQAPDKQESNRVAFEGAQITPYALDWLGAKLDPDAGKVLDAETLNARYGVDGYVSFARPHTQAEADYRSRAGARAAWRDSVLAASPLSGAESLWQGLKGGALDPVAIPTYFIGVGEGLKGGQALGEGVAAFGRGRLIASGVARGIAENTIGGVALEGFNYGLKQAAGEDYSLAQSFDNLAVGAVFGASFGAIGGHFTAVKAAKAGRAMDAGAAFDALIDTESRGRQFDAKGQPLTSPKGAIGVAQVMPGTGPEAAKLAGLAWDEGRYRNDADYNRALGKAYFLKQVDTFGDTDKAWAAYNAGPGAVKKAVKAHGADWLEHMPAETRAYVARNRGIVGEGGGSGAAPGSNARVVDLQSPAERAGTFEHVFDQVLDDSPVDIAAMLPAGPRQLRRVEDVDFHVEIPARVGAPDVAVTASGWEVPVRYAVVDLKDLTVSSDGHYPPDLRPAVTPEVKRLEARMDALEHEAPVIGRDGIVEAGNGDVVALRAADDATFSAYRDRVEAAGYDTAGIERPALVRVNASDMSHGDRIRYVREGNSLDMPAATRPAAAGVPEAVAPHPVAASVRASVGRSVAAVDRVRKKAAGGKASEAAAPEVAHGRFVEGLKPEAKAAPEAAPADKRKIKAETLIAADPELKALMNDIEAFDPAGEVRPEALENPQTIADVGRALALCMIEGGVK